VKVAVVMWIPSSAGEQLCNGFRSHICTGFWCDGLWDRGRACETAVLYWQSLVWVDPAVLWSGLVWEGMGNWGGGWTYHHQQVTVPDEVHSGTITTSERNLKPDWLRNGSNISVIPNGKAVGVTQSV
jgi:hypothetical protein